MKCLSFFCPFGWLTSYPSAILAQDMRPLSLQATPPSSNATAFLSFCTGHIKVAVILIFLLIQIQEVSYAQSDQIRAMVPQSPEAATLSRFGDYPVSYYTGSPGISIPLLVLDEYGLDLPINLDYNANGVRVADYSTWVGLNWNLFPGGSISRIVIGNKEDNHNDPVYNILRERWSPGDDCDYVRLFADFRTGSPSSSTTYAFLGCDIEAVPFSGGQASDNPSDKVILPGFPIGAMAGLAQAANYFQPDIYSFNFLGYSGHFYFNPQTNAPVILDKKDAITFERDESSSTWNAEEDGWIAKLPNGIEVYFQDIESVEQAVSSCTSGEPSLTWKISHIVLNNNKFQLYYAHL